MMRRILKIKWLDLVFFSLLLLGINLVLIHPYLFQSAPGWVESIEVSFITIGRWWAQNFPHIFWNPYWYAGFPMRFSYVPLVPISTALLGSLIHNFGQAYHLIIGISYALVPAALFLFIRYLTKNSLTAFIGALSFSLLPSLGNIFENVRAAQSLFGVQNLPPWRMMVLVFYGEGPHTAAQVFIPLAGVFYLKALEKKQITFSTIAAAIFIALTALSNPIGLWAVGLLLGSILIVFLLWNNDFKNVLKKSALTAVLSYLFAAFWYTPGFIRSDLFAEGGGTFAAIFDYFPWRPLVIFALFVVILSISRKFIRSHYTAVALFWFIANFFIVGVFYQFGVEFAPQARRYIPELDMAAVTLLGIILVNLNKLVERKFSRLPRQVFLLGITVVVLLVTINTWKASWWFTGSTNVSPSGQIEKKMNAWLSANVKETERVFLSTNYTFWANVDTNIWQLRGGHWQASIHPWEPHAGYQITSGEDGSTSLLWLKAFAIKWLVVNLPGSSVHYQDYRYPFKFEQLLPAPECIICPSDIVYKVPLAHQMAGPVLLSEMASLKVPQKADEKVILDTYVAWIEKSPNKLNFQMIDNDHYLIEGNIQDGEGVRVAMSFDKGFIARDEQGRKLKTLNDPLGFLTIEPKTAGPVKITLSYGPTFDFFLGWLLFITGVIWAAILIKRSNNGKD